MTMLKVRNNAVKTAQPSVNRPSLVLLKPQDADAGSASKETLAVRYQSSADERLVEQMASLLHRKLLAIARDTVRTCSMLRPLYDEHDICQHLLLAMVRAMKAYDPSRGAFSTLFRTYADRAIHALVREQAATFRRSNLHAVRWDHQLQGDESEDLARGEAGYDRVEFWDELECAGISDVHMRMLTAFAEGYSKVEIARKFTCTSPNVGQTLRRIGRHVRERQLRCS